MGLAFSLYAGRAVTFQFNSIQFKPQQNLTQFNSKLVLQEVVFQTKKCVGKLRVRAFNRIFRLKNNLMEQKWWTLLVDGFFGWCLNWTNIIEFKTQFNSIQNPIQFNSKPNVDRNGSQLLRVEVVFQTKKCVGKLSVRAFQGATLLLKNDLMEQILWLPFLSTGCFSGWKVIGDSKLRNWIESLRIELVTRNSEIEFNYYELNWTRFSRDWTELGFSVVWIELQCRRIT